MKCPSILAEFGCTVLDIPREIEKFISRDLSIKIFVEMPHVEFIWRAVFVEHGVYLVRIQEVVLIRVIEGESGVQRFTEVSVLLPFLIREVMQRGHLRDFLFSFLLGAVSIQTLQPLHGLIQSLLLLLFVHLLLTVLLSQRYIIRVPIVSIFRSIFWMVQLGLQLFE